MSYKLLKAIFVVLLVVTVFEAGYYFLVLNKTKVTSDAPLAPIERQALISQIQIEPSVTVSPIEANILNSNTIRLIRGLDTNKNHKIYFVREQQGFVGEKSFSESDNLHMLKIVDENGEKIVMYFFAPEKLAALKLFKIDGEKKSPILFSDINTGDKITVLSKEDMLNPDASYTEYLIN